MPKDGVMLGVCRDAGCTQSAKEPIELYDGPGRFCPECGEMLQRYSPPPPPRAPRQTAPRAAALPPFIQRHARSALIAAVACVLAGLCLVAFGGLGAPSVVGVCASSMGERVMRDLLDAYGEHPPLNGGRYEARTTNCQIHFGVLAANLSRGPRGTSVLGSDAIVPIVNPTNPVSQLNVGELRDIVAGRVTSWSALGGAARPIAVYLPDDGTDEGRMVAAVLMRSVPVGATVVRVASSSAAVHAVAAPSGANALALVAFSMAVPAKVVRLAGVPAPSVLSIANGTYPLAVRVVAVPADPDRVAAAGGGGLLTFAASPDAQAIAQRDGIAIAR